MNFNSFLHFSVFLFYFRYISATGEIHSLDVHIKTIDIYNVKDLQAPIDKNDIPLRIASYHGGFSVHVETNESGTKYYAVDVNCINFVNLIFPELSDSLDECKIYLQTLCFDSNQVLSSEQQHSDSSLILVPLSRQTIDESMKVIAEKIEQKRRKTDFDFYWSVLYFTGAVCVLFYAGLTATTIYQNVLTALKPFFYYSNGIPSGAV